MKPLQPIIVTHLFPEILDELLVFLTGLSEQEWDQPTMCSGWSVKDIVLHLFGDEIGLLSRKRDHFSSTHGLMTS
jgi:hypothetical protein